MGSNVIGSNASSLQTRDRCFTPQRINNVKYALSAAHEPSQCPPLKMRTCLLISLTWSDYLSLPHAGGFISIMR